MPTEVSLAGRGGYRVLATPDPGERFHPCVVFHSLMTRATKTEIWHLLVDRILDVAAPAADERPLPIIRGVLLAHPPDPVEMLMIATDLLLTASPAADGALFQDLSDKAPAEFTEAVWCLSERLVRRNGPLPPPPLPALAPTVGLPANPIRLHGQRHAAPATLALRMQAEDAIHAAATQSPRFVPGVPGRSFGDSIIRSALPCA